MTPHPAVEYFRSRREIAQLLQMHAQGPMLERVKQRVLVFGAAEWCLEELIHDRVS